MKKKTLVAVVVAIVLVGTVGILGGCGKSSQVASSSSKKAETSNMAVGDTVEMKNGLAVTVNEAEAFTPQYLNKPMKRVNVTYTNSGKDKQDFNLLDWKSENAAGVERSITAWADGSTDLGSGHLQPGGTVTGNIYFDGDDIAKVYYYSNVLFQSESDICWVL